MRTSTLKFVQQQKGGGSYARLDHVTRLELTYARPVLTEVIRQKHRLQMAAIQRR
jgi:predicted PP-loop superfamily ATPase